MTSYVVGFAFSLDRSEVLLVRKERPDWQAGKLNGVGGKIEPHDLEGQVPGAPRKAMQREFREETGIDVPAAAWDFVLTLVSGEHEIHFFSTAMDRRELAALDWTENDVGELLELWDVWDLATNSLKIPNLSWIVPLAAYTHDTYKTVLIEEVQL